MMRFARFIVLGFLLFVVAITPQKASAQFGACLPAFCNAVAPPSVCTEGDAFIARTTGIDAPHQAAYQAFICGLVADGIWLKFDAIYLYATQDQTTALLSLVSATYNSTLHGSPSFTVDVGFTGIGASATDYIDPNFNPTTAASPKYTQDSAHLSVWNLLSTSNSNPPIGAANGTVAEYLIPRQVVGGLSFARINGSPSGGVFTGIATPVGHFVGTRIDSMDVRGFRNGSQWGALSVTSIAPANLGIYGLGYNNNSTPSGSEDQLTMLSFGAGLTSSEVLKYYNRSRTYMTTLGVP